MAECAVTVVAQKLADLLIEEAVFLHDVRDEVVWIHRELKWMQSFLKDADAKQERDERMKEWVADIREVAYEAEDVIDTFIFKVASQRKQGFMGFVKRYVCIFNKCILLHEVGKEIEDIRTKILEISRRTSTYGVTNFGAVGGVEERTSSSSERLQQLRRSSPYASDVEFVIGLTGDINALVAELMKEEEGLCVVSIVGMGGLGKTTLARKIYNHGDVMVHFNCHAWVSISKEYRTREILQVIIKNISSPAKEELEMMTQDELEMKVHKLLEGRRYLVVLDDIWSRDAWDNLKNAFPDTRNKSRIMFTTRNKDVALYADVQTLPHELGFLSKDESWDLFCRKAFPENNIPSCPPNLEEFGRAMVERCGGLPLALLVLGGMLSRKNKSPHEWDRVLNNIHWHLTKGPDGTIISVILCLSYNDLPHYLKSCFMHFSLFPEDHKIDVTRLIRYWVAEGIIPQEGEETIEVVAEKCVNELIDRSLIQVVNRTTRGRAKICCVHDLLRELCISKAKDENLLLGNFDKNLDHVVLTKSSRLCAVHPGSGFVSYVADVSSLQQQFTLHLRTLIFFDHIIVSKEQMEFICRRCKLLRVLDLRNLSIKCLPNAIGKLIHLRYLSLDVGNLEGQIPPSIGNLQNLQHLQIKNHGKLKEIPNVIWKMERLRNVYIQEDLISSHLRIDTLRNLQSLRYIMVDCWIKGGNSAWANLVNLRDLRMHGISSSHMEVLFHSFRTLNHLHSLCLVTDYPYNVTFPTLTPLALFCPRLIKLTLFGHIGKLPHELPPNLTKLTLCESHLEQGSIVSLGFLPNLSILSLNFGSYSGKELIFIAKGFPQLQVLELQGLDELEEWRVEEGALVMLKRLLLHECKRLMMIPEGLRFMTNLKELVFSDMGAEFMDKLRGEDSYKVQHIPSITIEKNYIPI